MLSPELEVKLDLDKLKNPAVHRHTTFGDSKGDKVVSIPEYIKAAKSPLEPHENFDAVSHGSAGSSPPRLALRTPQVADKP